MGKRKQFKVRDKSTQRMTRDGLVTENQSTGEIHRVSTRSADFQLHHETAISQDFSHHRKESQFNSAGSGNRPFHPAQTGNHRAIHSDFHDSHTLYPEMTSAEPISPSSQNIIAPVDSLQNIENKEPLQFEESLHPQTILRQSVYEEPEIYNMGRRTAQGIYDICTPVSPTDAKPGDIIFFTGTYNSGCPVSHVGIYVGNGQMIHCGDPIQYTSINTSYWQNHFYAFGRVGG